MRKTIALALSVVTLLAENSIQIAPISVVGTGIEESVLTQPLSIATKGTEEIALDQVIFQKDLLNSLAGVQIEQTGSVIGHTTAIRMQKNTSAYYLFMQDGIPVQSSGFFNHNGLAYTTFQSASSVEVLKGAGTALYGSDAVAAVVNVHSLGRPSKEKQSSAKVMGGSNGFVSTKAEMSDTIDEKNAYRANVSYMHSDGWREHTKADRFEANVRYDHNLDDNNDIKIIFNASVTDAQQADSFNNYSNIENGSELASDDAAYYTALSNTDIGRKFDYARLSVEWNNYSFDNLDISLTPYLRYNRNRYVATWEKNYPSNDTKLATLGLLQRNTLQTTWGKLVAGFDFEYTNSSLDYTQDFTTVVSGFGGGTFLAGSLYDYDVNYLALAPYMHAEYELNKKLTLTAGLRYDYNRFDYDNNLADNSTDASGVYYRPADKKDTFSHVSPKLSLDYKMDDFTNLYARYANGFRIPQATRLYSMKSGYTASTLDPETSNTYEVGVKKTFNEQTFAELAVYHMEIDDTITSYQDANRNRYYKNGGKTIHQGVEATVDSQVTPEYAVHIAYSYSKHEFVNDATYNDNEIAEAPNHLANARLTYKPNRVKDLALMGEWQYVGSYWMDHDHVKEYGGYSIANLKLNYDYSKALMFFAKITNLTDKQYAVSARFAYGRDDYTPGDPRQFYAGINYKW